MPVKPTVRTTQSKPDTTLIIKNLDVRDPSLAKSPWRASLEQQHAQSHDLAVANASEANRIAKILNRVTESPLATDAPSPTSPKPPTPPALATTPRLEFLGESTSETSSKAKPRIAIVVGHEKAKGGVYSEELGYNEYVLYSEGIEAITGRTVTGNARHFNFNYTDKYVLARPIEIIFVTRDGVNGQGGLSGLAHAYASLSRYAGISAIFELHFNGAASTEANGIECLALATHNPSKRLAHSTTDAFQEHLLPALKTRPVLARTQIDRGGRSLALGAAIAPMTLIEPFFGTSPSDTKAVMKYRDKEAFVSKLLATLFAASLSV